ncbi:MAG TPA: hypothetical protein PKY88_08455 [Anaerohalosphaeraceae bacterium]|nr:hypothetical protein [Anaerohalosphaeraceae bacterium]
MGRIKQYYKAAVFGLILVGIGLLAGCTGAPGVTVKEVDQRHYRAIHSNWLMFQDDIDSILLLDSPSRLTPLYTR